MNMAYDPSLCILDAKIAKASSPVSSEDKTSADTTYGDNRTEQTSSIHVGRYEIAIARHGSFWHEMRCL
jgi:hypothetical protein